jgi:hypothetical protein
MLAIEETEMNDAEKRAMKDAWKKREQEKMEASIPIPKADLKALFDYLDRPDPPACTHTLKETIEFLKSRNLDVEKTIAWCRENGGHCDCEVIFNVEENFGPLVGRPI